MIWVIYMPRNKSDYFPSELEFFYTQNKNQVFFFDIKNQYMFLSNLT